MRYRIQHTTTYNYSDLVSLCHNLAHLSPRVCSQQRCLATSMHITPTPAVMSVWDDYFGNPTTFFSIQEPHRRLVVTVDHALEVQSIPMPNVGQSLPWEQVREQIRQHADSDTLQAYDYLFDSPYIQTSKELADYAAHSFLPNRPFLEAVLDLTHRIHTDFKYDPKATTVTTPLREMFVNRRGVCQDFAHLQIGCLRSLGLAARYISGYLCTLPPPGQPRLIGADASHAWISVFSPGDGWIDFDPTNDVIPADKHILLAWGRDYDDVSPIKGVILGGGKHTVTVGVDVIPEIENPLQFSLSYQGQQA